MQQNMCHYNRQFSGRAMKPPKIFAPFLRFLCSAVSRVLEIVTSPGILVFESYFMELEKLYILLSVHRNDHFIDRGL